jgi:hypothetical protein
MSAQTTLIVLTALLKLVAYFARRAGRSHLETMATIELETLHGKRVEDAIRARDDVLSGRVPAEPADPNRRAE